MRGPRVGLGVLCAAILAGASQHKGHSVESVDVRTYVQMLRGVADHGLPYWDNGPVDRFRALVVPWAVPRDGHLWGIYGPLQAYAFAPLFKLGGLPLVSAATLALMAPLAIITYLLALHFVKSEWYALVAATLAVLTPILAKSIELSGYPVIVVFAALATYFWCARSMAGARLGPLRAWRGARRCARTFCVFRWAWRRSRR